MPADTLNDGGAAFPVPNDDRPGAYPAEPGMSLRDWFAGMALANYVGADREPALTFDDVAADCYAMADHMLAERAKGPSNDR